MKNLNHQTQINCNETAKLIWNISDILRDTYNAKDYQKVILPFCVLKRFNDLLIPTKQKVLDTYEKVKDFEVIDGILCNASGYQFYNISKFDFNSLLNEQSKIETNFINYIDGFSENIKDILSKYNFDAEIKMLADNDLLYYVIKKYSEITMDERISATDMGYIFEELVKRYSESNAKTGQYFTSRDIVFLMTDILISEDKEDLIKNGVTKTVYDMAMGTSQMLTSMTEKLAELHIPHTITTYGQEINAETFAIAKSSALIVGQNPDNMRLGNTLTDDKFKDYEFDYIISNPPFGVDFNKDYEKIKKEYELGEEGRFAAGIPSKDDGQLLFTLNGIKKLKPTGKMAIIHDGSPLFKGGTSSGENSIRRYIIENDYLEAIIQLGDALFYNTEITSYLWIINKNKSENKKGKIQLIDASNCRVKLRKPINKKRYEITNELRELIIKAYEEFKDKEYTCGDIVCSSKIFYNQDFAFLDIPVKMPLFDENGNIQYKGKKSKKIIFDTEKNDKELVPLNNTITINNELPLIENEGIQDIINKYFEKEVTPYNPDAVIDYSNIRLGAEIPFTKLFYKYTPPEKSEDILNRIINLEKELYVSLNNLFNKGDNNNE